jgi:hypothetical protein
MNFKLMVFTIEDLNDYTTGKKYRFAVIDLDKSPDYPANFVCILPSTMRDEKKSNNIFQKTFGSKGPKQAKALLMEALENEKESRVKAEIERRLKMLEPKVDNQIICSSCRKPFLAKRVRRFKQNLCPGCLKKKYGNRE